MVLVGLGVDDATERNAPHIGPITDEFKFSLPSVEAWNEHEDQLTALTLKVCAAYNAAREEATTEQ